MVQCIKQEVRWVQIQSAFTLQRLQDFKRVVLDVKTVNILHYSRVKINLNYNTKQPQNRILS